MPRPRFFISAVAEEFSGLRQKVAELMLSLNYEVEMVDFADGELGDSRLMLRNRIDACEGLIQIVGSAYGPEPRDVFPSYERVSYAQFEFRYARSRGKSTWLLFAGPDVERDRPAMELDFPGESHAGDPAGYQAERRRLQQQYSQTLRREEGHRYSTFNNMTELENAILKLSHGSRELHENRLGWQQAKTVTPVQPQPRAPEVMRAPIQIQKKAPGKPIKKATPKALLTGLAGVVALGGGALLLSSLHGTPRRGAAAALSQEVVGGASTAAVATANPDELATKRRERVNRAYEKEKEALSREPVCDKTQNKIEDLERLHRDTLAAIERLQTGEDDHRPGMKELDEVLAEKTATESLGYVRSHWQDMLDAARSGAGSARRPAELLAACQIATDHGDYDLAQKMMQALVEAIPEWKEAHALYLDFALRNAGPRAEKAGLTFLARDRYRVAVAEADYLAKANAADSRAQMALDEGSKAVARLEKLVSESRISLRDMAEAFKAAVETNSEKAWDGFISKYGKVQVPNTDEDEGMISDAKQHLTVLRNAPTEKRPTPEHNPALEDLRDRLARTSNDLKLVNKEIENDQKIYDDNLATINKLTDYKRVPVVEGSPPYRVCLQASTKIQAVEARAPGLKEKKSRLTAELSGLQARLDALSK